MPLYALDDRTPTLPADDRYWVAPDANVIGKVILGEDVGIWFGATLRGDNEPIIVGARSNIQEGTVVHTDPGKPVIIVYGNPRTLISMARSSAILRALAGAWCRSGAARATNGGGLL